MPPLITQTRLLQRLASNPSTVTFDVFAFLTFLEHKVGIHTTTSTSGRAGMMNIILSTIHITTMITAFDPSTSLGFVVGTDVDGEGVIIFTC